MAEHLTPVNYDFDPNLQGLSFFTDSGASRPRPRSFVQQILEDLPQGVAWVSDFANGNELTAKELLALLRTDEAISSLEQIAGNIDMLNRYSLALLLTGISADLMPEGVRDKLSVYSSDDPAVILPFHEDWNLCNSSEIKLRNEMNDGVTVLVNDTLLVKDEGYLTGFCIRNSSTANGTFLRGAWYSPVDEITRRKIETTLIKGPDMGMSRLNQNSGEWVLMRDSSATYIGSDFSEFLNKVDEYVLE